jgi:hypothetical protein
MSDMNSALSVWQLVIMAVVPLAALCAWIITIFVVAREPRADAATAASPADKAAGWPHNPPSSLVPVGQPGSPGSPTSVTRSSCRKHR